MCYKRTLEECERLIKSLQKDLEETIAENFEQLFRLARLGDKKSINKIDTFLKSMNIAKGY